MRTSRSGVSSSLCSFPGYSSSARACMHAQLESVWSVMHPAREATHSLARHRRRMHCAGSCMCIALGHMHIYPSAPLHSCSDVHEQCLHRGTCRVLQPGSRLEWEGVQGLVSTLTPSELTFGMVKGIVTQQLHLLVSTVQ